MVTVAKCIRTRENPIYLLQYLFDSWISFTHISVVVYVCYSLVSFGEWVKAEIRHVERLLIMMTNHQEVKSALSVTVCDQWLWNMHPISVHHTTDVDVSLTFDFTTNEYLSSLFSILDTRYAPSIFCIFHVTHFTTIRFWSSSMRFKHKLFKNAQKPYKKQEIPTTGTQTKKNHCRKLQSLPTIGNIVTDLLVILQHKSRLLRQCVAFWPSKTSILRWFLGFSFPYIMHAFEIVKHAFFGSSIKRFL